MTDLENTYLYYLPGGDDGRVESGEVKHASGGLRPTSGKEFQVKQVVPSPLNMDKILDECVSKFHAFYEDERSRAKKQLVTVEREKDSQLTEVANYVDTALRANAALTAEGFRRTFARLDDLSAQIRENRAIDDAWYYEAKRSEARKYVGWLQNDFGKYHLKGFDSINSDASTRISTISDFLSDLYDDLWETPEKYHLYPFLIIQLISPFTEAVFTFTQRYYKDSEELPSSLDRWLETISIITGGKSVSDGYEYFLRLNDGGSYLNKMIDVGAARRKLSEANGVTLYLQSRMNGIIAAGFGKEVL